MHCAADKDDLCSRKMLHTQKQKEKMFILAMPRSRSHSLPILDSTLTVSVLNAVSGVLLMGERHLAPHDIVNTIIRQLRHNDVANDGGGHDFDILFHGELLDGSWEAPTDSTHLEFTACRTRFSTTGLVVLEDPLGDDEIHVVPCTDPSQFFRHAEQERLSDLRLASVGLRR